MSTENKSKVGEFCWNELATADVSKAKKFYGDVFGWQFNDFGIEGMTYTQIRKEGQDFGGIWAIPTDLQKEIPPHWMGYILVEDVAKAVEKATQCGATIKRDVTAAGDHGKFAILQDPTGAHIALWQSLRKV